MELDAKMHAIIAGVTLLLSIIFIAILKTSGVILFFLFLAFWGVLLFLDFDKDYLYLSAAALGTCLISIIVLGLFNIVSFNFTTFAGLPIWIPVFVVNAVVITIKISNWVSEARA